MKRLCLLATLLLLTGCNLLKEGKEKQARLCMFVGVDISGSFMRGRYFDDSLNFLANYLYGHLNGIGGLEKPQVLFVGSIGGNRPGEAKTFFPIQTFENKSVGEIRSKLHEIFPKNKENALTDYNAFFEQVTEFARNKKLVLRPISIIMLTDGLPAIVDKKPNYRAIDVHKLENLSRNITLRVLYTKADVAVNWLGKVPRKKVKIWSQDGQVMKMWNDSNIFIPGVAFNNQKRFFSWVLDNVDFPAASKRVD